MKKVRALTKRLLAGGISVMIFAGLMTTPVLAADELVNTPYEYPITPGTPEWASYQSFQDRIDVCQIPKEIYQLMSTEVLIQSILNYPIWEVYMAYEPDKIYDIYKNRLDAISELERRKDADSLLLKAYQNEPVVTSYQFNNSSEYIDIYRLDYYEILLAEPVFHNDLSDNELEILDKVVEEKQQLRDQEVDCPYSDISLFYRILSAKQNGISTRATTHVYTPRGTAVDVEYRNQTMDVGTKSYWNSRYAREHPTATRLREPTKNYNCHSYAWYSESESNHYWMYSPQPYMSDGSYKIQKYHGTLPAYGTKVFYDGDNNIYTAHSCIVKGRAAGTISNDINKNLHLIICYSKWGEAGL